MSNCNQSTTLIDEGIKLQNNMDSAPINQENCQCLFNSLIFYTNTCPNLAYSVSILSRFKSAFLQNHTEAAKRVLRYICKTTSRSIFFPAKNDLTWLATQIQIGDEILIGFLFKLGIAPIAWLSKLQPIVFLSTTEAKYKALSDAAKEVTWIVALRNIKTYNDKPTQILCNNT